MTRRRAGGGICRAKEKKEEPRFKLMGVKAYLSVCLFFQICKVQEATWGL